MDLEIMSAICFEKTEKARTEVGVVLEKIRRVNAQLKKDPMNPILLNMKYLLKGDLKTNIRRFYRYKSYRDNLSKKLLIRMKYGKKINV